MLRQGQGWETGTGAQSARGADLRHATGALKCWQQQPVLETEGLIGV